MWDLQVTTHWSISSPNDNIFARPTFYPDFNNSYYQLFIQSSLLISLKKRTRCMVVTHGIDY